MSLQLHVWSSRAASVIGIVIASVLIHRNIKNKRNAKNNEKSMKTPKYLDIWSTATFIAIIVTLSIMFISKIPSICSSIVPLYIFGFYFPRTCLSFFQISRLELCFSQSQVHSKFGYPKCVFIILYIIGFCQLILSIYWAYLYSSGLELPITNLGCDLLPKNPEFNFYSTIQIGTYSTWDWTIIILYAIKIYQFKNKLRKSRASESKTSSENTQEILKRIQIILNKIIFLTLITELSGFMVAGVRSAFVDTDSVLSDSVDSSDDVDEDGIIAVIIAWLWGIDNCILVYITFLMLEHNEKEYLTFIKIMDKLYIWYYCCCCFKSLSKQIENDDNDGKNVDTAIKLGTTEQTIDTNSDVIDLEMQQYDTLSKTETVATF
mmetsp:Transcript_24944/g.21821  ORF Transcript_24944/g.21821 Transcript_24944/m.21821 type:complete len:377 (-) Transcript_24944:180-1310(-)